MQKRRGLLRHRLGYGAQIIMVSAANPRFAKGQNCYHAKKLRPDSPPTETHEGAFCEQDRWRSTGEYKTSGSKRW